MLQDLSAAAATEHQRDLRDAADRYRLARGSAIPGPGRSPRLALGRWMVALGSKLIESYPSRPWLAR